MRTNASAICPECGKRSDHLRPVDLGFGEYVYGSQRGVHHDWRWYCPHCEAELPKEIIHYDLL